MLIYHTKKRRKPEKSAEQTPNQPSTLVSSNIDCCLKMPISFSLSLARTSLLCICAHLLGLVPTPVGFICRKYCTWENMQPKFLSHRQKKVCDSQPLFRCHQRQHVHEVRARQLYPHRSEQYFRTGPLLAGGPGQGVRHPPDLCLWT